MAQFLNPIAVAQGWKDRSEELQKRAYTPATGYVHDVLNKYMPTEWGIFHGRGLRLGRETEHGFLGKLKVINEESKHLEGIRLNREYAAYIKKHVGETGAWEDKMGMELLTDKNNSQDDFHNIHGGTKEQPLAYSPYIDLEYTSQNYMKEMSKEEKEMTAIQKQEQQEELGRWRSYFYDEDNNTVANDLTPYQDTGAFRTEMSNLVNKLKAVDEEGFAGLIRRAEAAQSVSDISREKDSELYEAFVSHRLHKTLTSKMRRGRSGKWAQGFEPAPLRLQTNKGWEGYTTYGKMTLKTIGKAILQAWIGRIHEGQERALVAGGAMVDATTGAVRLPNKNDGVYWKAWQDVVKIRPELAAATWSYFHDSNKTRPNFDAALEGKKHFDLNKPEKEWLQE